LALGVGSWGWIQTPLRLTAARAIALHMRFSQMSLAGTMVLSRIALMGGKVFGGSGLIPASLGLGDASCISREPIPCFRRVCCVSIHAAAETEDQPVPTGRGAGHNGLSAGSHTVGLRGLRLGSPKLVARCGRN
jgi:hypothetical protein